MRKARSTHEALDVLLVNPCAMQSHNATRMAKARPYPPLGLMVLGAVLKKSGYQVELYDGTFDDSPARLHAYLRAGPSPRVVGVYAMSPFREDALLAIKHMKELGTLVFAGGPDPSVHDVEYLAGGADAVVRGAGEGAILELLAAYGVLPSGAHAWSRSSTHLLFPMDERLLAIPGVSFLDRDVHPRRSPDRPGGNTMDDLPSPDYGLVDIPRYLSEWRRVHGYASIQLGQYSPGRAVDEIERLVVGYGVDHLWLFDDTFARRREWVEEFCDRVVAHGVEIRWECLASVDLVDYALLASMRRAGCERITFRVEPGARRVAKDMHELGITMGGEVEMGHAGEGWRDIEGIISLLKDLAPVDYATSVAPAARYSAPFYLLIESLMHSEYDLSLEFTLGHFMRAKALRGLLASMRLLASAEEGVAQ